VNMANSKAFLAHVLELGGRPGTLSARPMFGGHGIYTEGIIVGIVIDDTLYLKSDDGNRGEFDALGLEPFVYQTRQGERHAMSYRRAPDEALEGAQAMRPWLRSALGASLRAAAAKPPKKPAAPRTKKLSAPRAKTK
jgi:DNA transformation protein and related proteins